MGWRGRLISGIIAAAACAGALFFGWEPIRESFEKPETSAKEAHSIGAAYALEGAPDAELRSIPEPEEGREPDGKAPRWRLDDMAPIFDVLRLRGRSRLHEGEKDGPGVPD